MKDLHVRKYGLDLMITFTCEASLGLNEMPSATKWAHRLILINSEIDKDDKNRALALLLTKYKCVFCYFNNE